MISHHSALIYTMVLVSASDGNMTDAEMNTIGDIIKNLPIFRDFDQSTIAKTAEDCAELLAGPDGPEEAARLIDQALPNRLRETAYALACDIAAADGAVSESESEMLRWMRNRLNIGRLEAAAIERGARAHYMTL